MNQLSLDQPQEISVGVGLRSQHHEDFLLQTPKTVSWVEVISENFMPWKKDGWGSDIEILKRIRQNLPVALHGVSMNLGSASPLDRDYLERLKKLITVIEPTVISDHLSWTGVGNLNSHDLLPLPYTSEALENIIGKIQKAQDFLGRKMLIENPSSYLEFSASEIPETEFIKTVVKRTGCSLLLDVNNVFVCSVNHGFAPETYLRELQGCDIGQLHLAGHTNMNGHLIDTHDQPVAPEVWNLYRIAFELYGPKPTMIERDDHIPSWGELESELANIKEVAHGASIIAS